MAIVKAKYVRGKSRIKAHLRYITHRRGMDGERMSRPLFGRDGPLSKLQIYDMIDATRRGRGLSQIRLQFSSRQRRYPQRPEFMGSNQKNPGTHQNTIWRQRAVCRNDP